MSVELRQEFALPGLTARFRFAGHSHRGTVRRINEDSFLASAPFFVVADGMGGHAFGDRASQAAVAAFADSVDDEGPANAEDVISTISRANDAVRGIAEGEGLSGTTLTGVAFIHAGSTDSVHWMVFNVGDSRTYEWNGRVLVQVTVDHSAVQELVDRGQITRVEADSHPDRNIVTRALGADDDVDPDLWILPARAHQTFILCSDGLTKELNDDEIARIIAFHGAESIREGDGLPVTLAERLVNAAVAAGGSDNVTVVVVECELVGADRLDAADETVDRVRSAGIFEDTRPRG